MALEEADLVVLLDENDQPAGTAPRTTVHTTDTPLHLAFSCYLLDAGGRVLLTRRAVSKRTWPGVWTNSFCGHPRPGEDPADAVRRRAREELGTSLTDLRCVLPDFRYRAVDAGGVVENELCPVYTASFDGYLSPDPAEVEEVHWVPVEEMLRAAEVAPWALSPWLVSQLEQLRRSEAWAAVTTR